MARNWLWIAIVAVVFVATIQVVRMTGEEKVEPGQPSPHALDQSE